MSLSGISEVKRTLINRNVLNRKINDTYYFPFANGQCLVITALPVSAEFNFQYNEVMKSVTIDFVPTDTIEDIKHCNFEPSDLLTDELYTLLNDTLPAFRNKLEDQQTIDAINLLLGTEGDTLNQELLLDFFNVMCPVTCKYLEHTFNFYESSNTIDNIKAFLLVLMLLTATKTLSNDNNKRYTIQKAIMLTGDGQTGKSSLLNFFATLSLNAHQAVEVSHINNQFESYA